VNQLVRSDFCILLMLPQKKNSLGYTWHLTVLSHWTIDNWCRRLQTACAFNIIFLLAIVCVWCLVARAVEVVETRRWWWWWWRTIDRSYYTTVSVNDIPARELEEEKKMGRLARLMMSDTITWLCACTKKV
jgi:hypothetical protein